METNKVQKKYFTQQLTAWHTTDNNRQLPWKNEQDPYRIWLSEVILQQTRALQGLPYYMRFTEAFPTIERMAAASDDEAFRLWQGLGYYNRCKNMLATARYISNDLGGRFPETYQGLLELKGVGPYTAAAIASFAYGAPQAVVDGNVYRVLARYFGIDTPFDTTEGKKAFAQLAQELLNIKDSAGYNQAIMDLGATICTPKAPKCTSCPLQDKCVAFINSITALLPVKSKKLTIRKRYFHYLLLRWEGTIWIHKRGEGDIWGNLHEPLLVEEDKSLTVEELTALPKFNHLNLNYSAINYGGHIIQRLTHQLIESRFFTIVLNQKPDIKSANGQWLKASDLKKVGFPKTLVSFLENNLYF